LRPPFQAGGIEGRGKLAQELYLAIVPVEGTIGQHWFIPGPSACRGLRGRVFFLQKALLQTVSGAGLWVALHFVGGPPQLSLRPPVPETSTSLRPQVGSSGPPIAFMSTLEPIVSLLTGEIQRERRIRPERQGLTGHEVQR
jgi:hypothetical protein